jgi:hypothetical protein
MQLKNEIFVNEEHVPAYYAFERYLWMRNSTYTEISSENSIITTLMSTTALRTSKM